MTGVELTVTVKGIRADEQEDVLFCTCRLKSYVPAGVLDGRVMAIGLLPRVAPDTAVKPAMARVPAVMLYLSGLSEVAENGSGAVTAPKQTIGLVPGVKSGTLP